MAEMGEPPGVLIGFWNEDEMRKAGVKSVHPKVD